MYTPKNKFTGKEYQGQNVARLAADRDWATFLQWRDNGYKVKKGSKGTKIFVYAPSSKKVIDKKTKQTKSISLSTARCYSLFNSHQVEQV